MKARLLVLFLLIAAPAQADTLFRGFTEVCMDYIPTCTVLNPIQINLILTVQPYFGPVWDSWHGAYMVGPAWEIIGLDGAFNQNSIETTFSPTGIHGISWLPSGPQSPPGIWIEFAAEGKQHFISYDAEGATVLLDGVRRLEFRAFNPAAVFSVPEPASVLLLAIGLVFIPALRACGRCAVNS